MDEHVNYILTKAYNNLKKNYPSYRIHFYKDYSNNESYTNTITEVDIANGDIHIRFEYSEDLNPWAPYTSGLHMIIEIYYKSTNSTAPVTKTFPGTSNIPIEIDDMLSISNNINLPKIFDELALYLEISHKPQDNSLYLLTYSKAMFQRIKFLVELSKIPTNENIYPEIRF